MVAMGKDAVYFFLLLSIYCVGFSCALTPMLFKADNKIRSKFGISWSFWAITGDIDDEIVHDVKARDGLTGFFAQVLPRHR